MHGYVICRDDGNRVMYLSKDLFWFSHDSPSDAWVFSDQEFLYIVSKVQEFQYKPTHIFSAIYDGKKTIIGELFLFEE